MKTLFLAKTSQCIFRYKTGHDIAESEPCKVCPLSMYISLRVKTLSVAELDDKSEFPAMHASIFSARSFRSSFQDSGLTQPAASLVKTMGENQQAHILWQQRVRGLLRSVFATLTKNVQKTYDTLRNCKSLMDQT